MRFLTPRVPQIARPTATADNHPLARGIGDHGIPRRDDHGIPRRPARIKSQVLWHLLLCEVFEGAWSFRATKATLGKFVVRDCSLSPSTHRGSSVIRVKCDHAFRFFLHVMPLKNLTNHLHRPRPHPHSLPPPSMSSSSSSLSLSAPASTDPSFPPSPHTTLSATFHPFHPLSYPSSGPILAAQACRILCFFFQLLLSPAEQESRQLGLLEPGSQLRLIQLRLIELRLMQPRPQHEPTVCAPSNKPNDRAESRPRRDRTPTSNAEESMAHDTNCNTHLHLLLRSLLRLDDLLVFGVQRSRFESGCRGLYVFPEQKEHAEVSVLVPQ